MNSSFIGKIDKARKYAEERDRVSIDSFHATFEGNHNTYQVSFESGEWKCECLFFHTRGVCSHIMALQRMLDDVLAQREKAQEAVEAAEAAGS